MARSQAKSKQSPTGKKYRNYRKKRLHELGTTATMTKLGVNNRKTYRIIGGNQKQRNLAVEEVNVYDPTTKKNTKLKIKNVLENAANRFFIRRNVITKGAIVETEKGKAKVTSRPGQTGSVNAVLIE